ncbi:MAG: urate hydroxylase PuuD [Thermoanaerobaculia bacterium]
MAYSASELINLALRWLHVLAGIFWIGQTALFAWLDTRLRRSVPSTDGAEIWMVHGGGFYRVEKLPWQVPARALHWFKWESAVTWVSGFLLLAWIYYGGRILVPPEARLGPVAAITVSIAVLAAGWVVYDLLWNAVPVRRELVGTVVSLALLVALAWGLSQLFTGRAVFIQVGATLGTIMTANVWMRILPAMRQAVAAAGAGRELDEAQVAGLARAARRSRHNTFLAFPVVFLMISNHYPVATYGHRLAWAVLPAFVVVGFAARWVLNRIEARR